MTKGLLKGMARVGRRPKWLCKSLSAIIQQEDLLYI